MQQSTTLPRPTSDRRASKVVELVGDPLDCDLQFRYLGVVNASVLQAKGCCATTFSKSIKMPLMMRADSFRLMFQRA